MRVVGDYYKLLPSLYGKSDVDNIGVCVRGKGVGWVLLFYCVCSFLQFTIYTRSLPLVMAV